MLYKWPQENVKEKEKTKTGWKPMVNYSTFVPHTSVGMAFKNYVFPLLCCLRIGINSHLPACCRNFQNNVTGTFQSEWQEDTL